MDLAQTRTSTTNDVAGDGVRNGEGGSDAGLIHGGDGVDSLLGATCRRRRSAGVPATTRRVGRRISRATWCRSRSWGRRRNQPKAGGERRVLRKDLAEVCSNGDQLLASERGRVRRHGREGQSRKVGWWRRLGKAVAKRLALKYCQGSTVLSLSLSRNSSRFQSWGVRRPSIHDTYTR